MIGKIKYGSKNSFGALLEYSMQESKMNSLDSNMAGQTSEELTKEFEMYADLNKRCSLPAARYIIGISKEDEDKLSPDDMKAISKEYLSKMGYPDSAPYVAVSHRDTDNVHLHIIAARINPETGKTISSSNDYYKGRTACKALENKYNLTKTRYLRTVQEKQQEAGKDYNLEKVKMTERKAQENKQKLQDYAHVKTYLKLSVKEILNESKNEKELKEKLSEKGINLEKNKAVNGYNFEYNGVKFKASEVDRELSYARINGKFKQRQSEKNMQTQYVEQIKTQKMEEKSKEGGMKASISEDVLERISKMKKEHELKSEPRLDKEQNNSLSYGQE